MAILDLQYNVTITDDDFLRQSGFCVSGLTVRKASELVRKMDAEVYKTLLVNIGSVDIAEGRNLRQLLQDMIEFVRICKGKKIKVVLTTVPKLANGIKSENLIKFNDYLRSFTASEFPVIDLNLCLCNDDGTLDPDLYQQSACLVSGSKKSFVLWNKLGRTQIHEMIKKNLRKALASENGLFNQIP
jgi:hypothetical protein